MQRTFGIPRALHLDECAVIVIVGMLLINIRVRRGNRIEIILRERGVGVLNCILVFLHFGSRVFRTPVFW